MQCEYYGSCKNSDKCYRCYKQQLLKLGGRKENKVSSFIPKHDVRTAQADDSWKDLEQQVADKLNNIPTIQDARRSRASGALWFEKGDVVDDILHPECKERSGHELKGGDKSMSIKREWLEKAREECRLTQKTMCLPFRFKGDSRIYCIFDNDDIASLIVTMKSYMLDNERLTVALQAKDLEIERLKEMLKGLPSESEGNP